VTPEASSRAPEGSPDQPESRRSEARPERICPNCGAALVERKCKLLCPEPACGYFMSCSDFV
jgi:hypothetical protein